MPVHAAAAEGFQAGAAAYERGRPGYPPAALELVLSALALIPGAPLLDLGAGTGTFSRLAAQRGARVLAVEPVAAMRARLAGIPGVQAVAATAERLPLRDASVGGAAAATAFHWFDGRRALAELHRVLRPGARVALLWNLRDDAVGWIRSLTALVDEAERPGVPRYRTGRWREPFGAERARFHPVGEARFRHVHLLPPEGVVDRIASISFIAAMAAAARERLLERVRTLLASHPETAGRAELPLAYTTDVFLWERR
ncbi:MAG: class I SAM-dependent methyltransferase [Anaeromyxobacter sp.]